MVLLISFVPSEKKYFEQERNLQLTSILKLGSKSVKIFGTELELQFFANIIDNLEKYKRRLV